MSFNLRLNCLMGLAILSLTHPALAADDVLVGPVEARVVKVVDGDTIVVRARIWLSQELETSVRLLGIDTPERNGKCRGEREKAAEATEFVRARVAENSLVWLHDVSWDKYAKRVVARIVTADGTDLSQAILQADLARDYHGKTKQPWCAKEEVSSR